MYVVVVNVEVDVVVVLVGVEVEVTVVGVVEIAVVDVVVVPVDVVDDEPVVVVDVEPVVVDFVDEEDVSGYVVVVVEGVVVEGMSTYRNSGSYLSIVEYYTGYRIIVPLKYSTAAEVAKIIEKDIISTFGPPLLMISDGGSNLLRSAQVKKLLNFYGVQSHITSPYHPASHGRIEISHASITTLLK